MRVERAVEVELLELDPAVLDHATRQELETDEERAGVVATVRLGDARSTTSRFWSSASRRAASSIVYVLPTPGRRAEEDGELAARGPRLLFAHAREQLVGIGAFFGHSALIMALL